MMNWNLKEGEPNSDGIQLKFWHKVLLVIAGILFLPMMMWAVGQKKAQ